MAAVQEVGAEALGEGGPPAHRREAAAGAAVVAATAMAAAAAGRRLGARGDKTIWRLTRRRSRTGRRRCCRSRSCRSSTCTRWPQPGCAAAQLPRLTAGKAVPRAAAWFFLMNVLPSAHIFSGGDSRPLGRGGRRRAGRRGPGAARQPRRGRRPPAAVPRRHPRGRRRRRPRRQPGRRPRRERGDGLRLAPGGLHGRPGRGRQGSAKLEQRSVRQGVRHRRRPGQRVRRQGVRARRDERRKGCAGPAVPRRDQEGSAVPRQPAAVCAGEGAPPRPPLALCRGAAPDIAPNIIYNREESPGPRAEPPVPVPLPPASESHDCPDQLDDRGLQEDRRGRAGAEKQHAGGLSLLARLAWLRARRRSIP